MKKIVTLQLAEYATIYAKRGINNFVARLQTVAEHCDYNDEKDNQIRDCTLTFVASKQLKAKLYHESGLTLSKLLEIVSSYHDKEALILIPANPNQAVNHLHTS